VVWIIVSNDLEPKAKGRTAVPPEKLMETPRGLDLPGWYKLVKTPLEWLALRSHSGAIVERLALRGYRAGLSARYVDPESPQAEDAGQAVLSLGRLMRSRGVPVVATIHGERKSEFGRALHALYRSFLRQAGIHVFDLPEEIYRRSNVNAPLDPHPNRAGIKMIARAITEELGRAALCKPGAEEDCCGFFHAVKETGTPPGAEL